MTDARQSDRGFALLSVVWLLLLVAVLGSVIVLQAVAAARDARNARDRVRAGIVADSALEIVAFDLLSLGQRSRWGRADGAEHVVTTSTVGVDVTAAVSDEGGRIDLQSGDLALIASWAVKAFGPKQGAALASRLTALRRVRTTLQTRSAALALLDPEAAALATNEDWTVYSGKPGPDPALAPNRVKLLLATTVSDRLTSTTSDESTTSGLIRIRIKAKAGSASAMRVTILRLTGGAAVPVLIAEDH